MRVRRRLTRVASCGLLVIGVLAGTPNLAGAAASAAVAGAGGTGIAPTRGLPQESAPGQAEIHQTTERADVAREPAINSSAGAPTVRLRQQGAASPGTPVHYLIEVHNPGADRLTEVGVYQLLSPVHGSPAADPEPAASSTQQLRWAVSLEPGETARLRTHALVSTDATSSWNLVGLGSNTRLGSTVCVAPDPDGAVSGCDTVRAEAVLAVPWWRSWYALAGYALIAIVGVLAGIVWIRRRGTRNGRDPGRIPGPFLGSRA